MSTGSPYTGRRMSFGIGGAGNIREWRLYATVDRLSDQELPSTGNVTEATVHDFYVAQDGHGRRRSSAADSSSASSPSRASKFIDGMKSMFGSSPPKDAEKRSS